MTKTGNESLLLTKIKEKSFFDLSNKNQSLKNSFLDLIQKDN